MGPTAFRPLLLQGLALLGLSFLLLSFFFGRPLNHLSQKGDLKLLMELTFKRKILNCIDQLLKAFLHPKSRYRKIENIWLKGFRDIF